MADLSQTAANVVAGSDAIIVDGIAAVSITQGQTVYLNASNKYDLADANGASPSYTTAGIALNAASLNQPIRVQIGGGINPGATVTVGKIYVQSATPGAIAVAADLASGHYVSIIGVGTTATNIQMKLFNSGVAVP